MARSAPHAHDPPRRRAIRRACLAAAPEFYFATHFLPAVEREAVDCLVVVLAQLHQVMIPAPPAQTPPHLEGCAECSGGGESVPQRRAVCSAILDHLLAGRPTGKLELDGFAHFARAACLDRADLDRYCDGLATQATLARYASWKRLRQMCDQSAGSAALMTFAILRGDSAPETHSTAPPTIPPTQNARETAREQTIAWGAALRMARLLESVGHDVRAGHLRLPLDDLVKFGVKESEISALARAGRLPSQGDIADRWSALMTFEIERGRRLYDGGLGCLAALPESTRRAMAIFGEMQMDRLQRIEKSGYDVFAEPVPPRLWRKLSILSRGDQESQGQKLAEIQEAPGNPCNHWPTEEDRAKARR